MKVSILGMLAMKIWIILKRYYRTLKTIKYKSSQSAKYNCIVLWNDGYFDFVDGTREIFE